MRRPYRRKTVEEVRKIFLERHKEWEALNNPEGIRSGKMRSAWDKRTLALIRLVRREKMRR